MICCRLSSKGCMRSRIGCCRTSRHDAGRAGMLQKELDRLHNKQDQLQDEQVGCGEHIRLKEEQDQLQDEQERLQDEQDRGLQDEQERL